MEITESNSASWWPMNMATASVKIHHNICYGFLTKGVQYCYLREKYVIVTVMSATLDDLHNLCET